MILLLISRRSAGSTSPSMATTFGQPNRSKTASGHCGTRARHSSTPLSVGFWEDSAMTPSLEKSLDGAGIRFNAPIQTNVVGPPIHELIDRLGLNRTDEQQLHAIQLFRAHYDHSDMHL